MSHQAPSPLPDPDYDPELFSGTATKRLLAWVIDTLLIIAAAAIAATLPLFIGWFFFPLILLAVSLAYRISSISRHSATPGMRLFNIELRNAQGQRLTVGESALHTIAFLIASASGILQLVSIILMISSAKGQGLHDFLCGTIMINRPQT